MGSRIKKNIKIFALVIIILFNLLEPVSARTTSQVIKVGLNTVDVVVNGNKIYENNILYKDTTYVPLRATAEMLGKEVGWDQETRTVMINDRDEEIDQVPKKGRNFKEEKNKNIRVNLNKINILVNGNKVNEDNILYKDTTYVPLRSISEMLENTVKWDPITRTAIINDWYWDDIYDMKIQLYSNHLIINTHILNYLSDCLINDLQGYDVTGDLAYIIFKIEEYRNMTIEYNEFNDDFKFYRNKVIDTYYYLEETSRCLFEYFSLDIYSQNNSYIVDYYFGLFNKNLQLSQDSIDYVIRKVNLE